MTARLLVLALLFLAGGFSQIVQALMARELLVVFYGNELSLGIFYAAWLLWIAAGSWCFGRLSSEFKEPRGTLAALLSLMPAAAAGAIVLLRACRGFIDASPSQLVPLDQLAAWSLLATLPVGVLLGAMFPVACRVLEREEEVSNVYVWDALGGLAGGALFTFFFVERLSPWRTLAVLTAALGGLLAAAGGGRRARAGGAAWAVVGLAVLLSPLGARLDAWGEGLRWRAILPKFEILDVFDTPYQNVAVARLGGQTSVVADGRVTASFPEKVEPAARAALIYSQNPKAKRVLIVEGAAGGLIPELLKYPVERIDCLEADEKAFGGIRRHLPEAWREALADKRVRLRFEDPRLFFRRLPEPGVYDIIVALAPEPATAHLNRLFTRELYRRAAAALSERGVFVTRITSASNYLGREVRAYGASVYRTLKDVFPAVRVTPGDSNTFLAAKKDGVLTLEPTALARRYLGVRVKGRTFPPEGFYSMLPEDRVAFVEGSLSKAGGSLNTDLQPVTYYLNMLLWGHFTGSEWLDALELVRRVGARFFLLPFLVLVALRAAFGFTGSPAEGERSSAGLAAAALGFSAMALELVLLFTYQSLFGHIYQRIGLLNGIFMSGLAGGAFAVALIGGSRARRPWRWLAASLGLTAVFAWKLPGLLAGAGEAGCWGLVLLSGVLAGSGFPAAVRLYNLGRDDAGRAGGSMDSADHLGGMAGALITGACLVPLFGVERSCGIASAVLGLACLPLLQREVLGLPSAAGILGRVSRLPVLRLSERAFVSFPRRRLSWTLLGAAVSVWLVAGAAGRTEPRPPERFSDAELAEVTGLERFELRNDPFVHYRAADASGKRAGVALGTHPHSADVTGYGGPLELLLGLSDDGKVLGLKLIKSRETPSYLEGIGAWLGKFRALDVRKGIRLHEDIDAFSGATVTSAAVVDIVNLTSKAAGEGLLGWEVSPVKAGGMRITIKSWAVAALLIAFFPVFLRGGAASRQVYLFASFLIMGLACNTLFTFVEAANVLDGRLPGAGAEWYLMAGFILLTSLLWGQAYCGFVCPFGALQELVWNAGKRLKLTAYPAACLDRSARYLKFALLSVLLCLYWAGERSGWLAMNPMQRIFSWNAVSAATAALTAVALGASLLYFRFWCRYLCPAGAFLALFNKLALGHGLAPKREFSRCDLGVRAEFDVDCIQCRRCLHARDDG